MQKMFDVVTDRSGTDVAIVRRSGLDYDQLCTWAGTLLPPIGLATQNP